VKLVLREAEGCGQPIIKNLKNINKKSFLCTALKGFVVYGFVVCCCRRGLLVYY